MEIPDGELNKISNFCNVKRENVIPALNVGNIYEVPLAYHQGRTRHNVSCNTTD